MGGHTKNLNRPIRMEGTRFTRISKPKPSPLQAYVLQALRYLRRGSIALLQVRTRARYCKPKLVGLPKAISDPSGRQTVEGIKNLIKENRARPELFLLGRKGVAARTGGRRWELSRSLSDREEDS